MSKKTHTHDRASGTAGFISKTSAGREVWRVFSEGERRTIVTSRESADVMDKATAFFAPALKRLADR